MRFSSSRSKDIGFCLLFYSPGAWNPFESSLGEAPPNACNQIHIREFLDNILDRSHGETRFSRNFFCGGESVNQGVYFPSLFGCCHKLQLFLETIPCLYLQKSSNGLDIFPFGCVSRETF